MLSERCAGAGRSVPRTFLVNGTPMRPESLRLRPGRAASLPGLRQIGQIRVNGAEFDVVHLAERTPRHPFAQFVSAGVLAGAQGADELWAAPSCPKTGARPARRQWPLNTAGQLPPVAFPA